MALNSLTPLDVATLAAMVKPGHCLTGDAIGPDYAHDELGGVQRLPDVLLKVSGTEEVAQIMRHANARHLPVVVRGSGTGLVGGAVATQGGIMLDTTGMNRILELDADNLTVTVEPGVLLMDLAQHVEEHGFLYPPDPGEKSATIGGNISTNAGGMRAVKYGVTRDFVRGLTVVLPGGTVMELGGKVVKNSSGYSLKDLIVGSEGTLAVITQAILKLVPLPACAVSLLVPFRDMGGALDMVPRIVRANAAPTAIEYMSRDTILLAESFLGKRFPDTGYPGYLLLTFDGMDKQQVERAYSQVADLCLDEGAEDVLLVETEENRDAVWSARGAFLEAIKASTPLMDECDVVVPRNHIAEYIRFTHQIAAELGMRIPSFGHAGDGNLHIYLCRDDLDEAQWEQRKQQAFDRMYARAAAIGGQVSGEHGIGCAKSPYLRAQLGEEQIALMRRIKAAFDPEGILNPGKVCD